MAETSNGVPYQELTDPPNGAALGQGIAEWIEDNAGNGSTQQVWTADTAAATKVGWSYPKARTAAPTPGGGALGHLWVPSSGADAGELFVHNGTAFAKVKQDVSLYATGEVTTPATKASPQAITSTATWTDVTGLSITTVLSTTRRYVAHAAVAVSIGMSSGAAGVRLTGYGRFLYGATHVGMLFAYSDDRALADGQAVTFLAEASTRPFVGTGVSAAVKIQAQKITAQGLTVAGTLIDSDFLAYLWLEDVGPI